MSTLSFRNSLPRYDGQAGGYHVSAAAGGEVIVGARCDLGAGATPLDGSTGLSFRVKISDLDNTALSTIEMYTCPDGSNPATAGNYTAITSPYLPAFGFGSGSKFTNIDGGVYEFWLPAECAQAGRYIAPFIATAGVSPSAGYDIHWSLVHLPGSAPVKDAQSGGTFTIATTALTITRTVEMDLSKVASVNGVGNTGAVLWFRVTSGTVTSYTVRAVGCPASLSPATAGNWYPDIGVDAAAYTDVSGQVWIRIPVSQDMCNRFRWLAIQTSGAGGGFTITCQAFWQLVTQ